MLDSILMDIRYAVRQLWHSPGFTLAAVISIALGMGANTAIFGVANAFLLKPIAGTSAASSLVRIYRGHHSPLEYDELRFVRDHSSSIAGLTGERMWPTSFSMGRDNETATASIVTGDYFGVLGVRPAFGRFVGVTNDSLRESVPAVVLSDHFWKVRFGADPSVVGRTIRVNDRPVVIVGIAPQSFSSSVVPWRPDFWIPIAEAPAILGRPADSFGGSFYMTARLKPGMNRDRARAELGAIARAIAATDTARYQRYSLTVDHVRGVNAEMRTPATLALVFLLVVVGAVLLIACANVANLLLARATSRSREIGVRLALGAGRGRLVRQLLTESVILALIGGGLALLVSTWTGDLINRIIPAGIPAFVDAQPDNRVVAYTILLALVTSVLFGLAPALRATRPSLVGALRDDVGQVGASRSRMRSALVTAQVTLCLLLLSVAALFLRSLNNATRMDPGFNTTHIVDLPINLSLAQYDSARGVAFYRTLTDRARAMPGVQAATISETVPLAGSRMETSILLKGEAPASREQRHHVDFNYVGASYFTTMGIPVLRGRDFQTTDKDGAPLVAIVNEATARRLWPKGDALGQQISLNGADGPWHTVVGIARNAKYNSVGEQPPPFVWVSAEQHYGPERVLQVRTAGDPGAFRASLAALVHEIEPRLPAVQAVLISQDMQTSLLPSRIGAALLAVFGGLALVLATVGIYGVTAYAVARRTREIGLRIALGATQNSVIRMVIGESMRRVGLGVAVGIVGSIAVSRLLASQLYEVGPVDPLAMLGTPLLLAVVALAATAIPARRAVRADPMRALRAD